MNNFTALERVMGDALLRNNIFYNEQVFTCTDQSYYIFDYVVYGEACKIVVECDGPHHDDPIRMLLDSKRDLWSIQNGVQSVLRFSMFDIYLSVEKCIEIIIKEIEALDAALTHDKLRKLVVAKEKEAIRRKKAEKSYSPYSNIRIEIWTDEERELKGKQELEQLRRSISRLSSNLGNSINGVEYKKSINEKLTQSKPKEKIADMIPVREREVLEILRGLPLSEKRRLWYIIQLSNNDGISIYKYSPESIDYLCGRKLLVRNNMYKGEGTSLIVLPDSPYLLRALLKW